MSARVLVVDDILPNVKLLEAKLMAEYYDVITATSGEEALRKVETDNPDLVLLDVMMPGMDGFEVCTRIKENPKIAHIPVVMVTALSDAADRVKGLESGADDFLSKPVNDIALMARVRSLVRLKMIIDEWRVRENTATQLGVVDKSANVMEESVTGAKILVVEDQTFEGENIKRSLSKDENEIDVVSAGIEAIKLCTEESYDLLIISLNLAEEDGLRLSSHLRSNERTRNVPILMIGNDDDMPRIAQGLEIGAHDYVLRPIDGNELIARVRTQIRRRRFQEHLRSNYEMSISMALIDSLTGLYNRRYFETHIQKLIQGLETSKKPLGVLMFDIDKFKNVNDTHGHGVGDEVLKIFADRMKDKLRSIDLIARLGGEEFVVILPDVTPDRAMFIAERLRKIICDEPIACSVDGGSLPIATSVGGVVINDSNITIEEILKKSDDALYKAKDLGRNCVVFDEVGKLNPEDYLEADRLKID